MQKISECLNFYLCSCWFLSQTKGAILYCFGPMIPVYLWNTGLIDNKTKSDIFAYCSHRKDSMSFDYTALTTDLNDEKWATSYGVSVVGDVLPLRVSYPMHEIPRLLDSVSFNIQKMRYATCKLYHL